MLRRQASTKVNLTRWQSGPRPGTRCPVRRQVNFIEGRSSFSVARPLPTTLKTEERQVPRAAGAQSAGLLHIGFILKHLFVDRSRLRVLTALQRTRELNPQEMAKGGDRAGPGAGGCAGTPGGRALSHCLH